MVGRDNDNGVVELADRIEHGDNASEMAVEMFNLDSIVENVCSDSIVVGPVSGH